MLALRHPVASSAPLAGAYGALHNGKRKIEKQRPAKLFLIFFLFQRDLSQHLGIVMSNIQKNLLTFHKRSITILLGLLSH